MAGGGRGIAGPAGRAAGERGGALRALPAGSAPAGTAAPRGTLRAGGALLAASPAPGVRRAVWAAGGPAPFGPQCRLRSGVLAGCEESAGMLFSVMYFSYAAAQIFLAPSGAR